MHKKYIVRLSAEERGICQQIIKHLKGSSQKFRRAQILLKADADASGWSDVKIAEAFDCRVQTIEHVRKRLVTEGFDLALNGQQRQEPPTRPKRDGEAEAPLSLDRQLRWDRRPSRVEFATFQVCDAVWLASRL